MKNSRPRKLRNTMADKPAPRASRTVTNASEVKVYGVNACSALWQNRAASIIRVYVTEDRMNLFGPLLKWCAKNKKAYHIVESEALDKIAQSVHHEGVVVLAQVKAPLNDEQCLQQVTASTGPCALIYLDGVQNPHNVGSIVRVAAHFGVPLILGSEGQLPRLTPSAARIAEGGIEHVNLAILKQPKVVLDKLKAAGFRLVGTSSHANTSLYSKPLPEKVIFIIGGEVEGASDQLLAAADEVRAIPGTGLIESINVAIATGICLGEFWRCHPALANRTSL